MSSAESLRNTMDEAGAGSNRMLKELMFKSGMFCCDDLQKISNTIWKNLEEMLNSTMEMNHFRTKYFNSQCNVFSMINESSRELLVLMQKLIKKERKKKSKVPIPGSIPDHDDQLDFLENIINVTSQQMQQVLEEGIKRGINIEEQPPVEPTPDPFLLDDNFGELSSIPAVLPAHSIETPFRPTISSTPLGTREDPVLIPLEMILEEEPMPPLPHIISEDALNPNQLEEQAIPQERLSQHTPRIPPPGITPRSSDRRVIPFNLNEPAAVPEAQEQQLPVLEAEEQQLPVNAGISNDQPDFPALRSDAIRRHVDASPRIPQRRVRPRDLLKPLELNVFRTPSPGDMTEARLMKFLAPTPMLLPPNIYLRPDKQSENTPSSIPAALQSHKSILQQSSSLHLPSTSREGTSSSAPSVPRQQPVSLQEIPEIPEAPQVPMPIETPQATMDRSGIDQLLQNVDVASVPQVHPNIPTIPEVSEVSIPPGEIPPQNIPPEEIPPVPEPQKERVMRILKMLRRKKEVSKEDFREEFSSKIELAGAFGDLLKFNRILWTMTSNQANEFISIKKMKTRD